MRKWLAALAVVLMSTACGAEGETLQARSPGEAEKIPAADVQTAYDTSNNQINKELDNAGIAKVETDPLKTFSQSWMKIKQQLGQANPPTTHTNPKFVVPAGQTYPRWFVSVATRVRGSVPSAKLSYTVFVQEKESAPWLAAYGNTPSERVPNPKDEAVTDFANLLLAPDAIADAIFKYYTAPSSGSSLARTPALEDQLASGYRVGTDMMRAKGWTLTRTLDATKYPFFALRTEDGGAIVFTANVITDVIAGQGAVSLDPGSNEGAVVGKPQGITAEKITIQRLQTFMVYVPTKAAGQQARVLAYNDTPIGVS